MENTAKQAAIKICCHQNLTVPGDEWNLGSDENDQDILEVYIGKRHNKEFPESLKNDLAAIQSIEDVKEVEPGKFLVVFDKQ